MFVLGLQGFLNHKLVFVQGLNMKSILLITLLLLCSQYAWAANIINYSAVTDQSGIAQTSMATPAIVTTTGNAIIVPLEESQNGNNVGSVTDTALNTYVQATSCYESSGSTYGNTDVWYALNITGNAANIVTVHFSGGGSKYPAAYQIQVSGLAASSPFETCGLGTAASNTVTSSSFAPANSGNLNIVSCSNNSGTMSAGTNYTFLPTGNKNAEYRLNAPAGAQTATCNNSTSNQITISAASFKVAPSVPTIIGSSKIVNAVII